MSVRQHLESGLTGRYEIDEEIGRGGMAVVYRGRDLKHHRDVAIKVLLPELTASLGAARFLREIDIASALQHPNILALYDSGEVPAGPAGRDAEPALLYFVMPYVEGESLRERLRREHQLPLDEAIQLTREVARGLDFAHRHGVVHRDIKPENIMVLEGHPVIADFGVARAAETAGQGRLTSTGLVVGTPLYMSPEQGTGDAGIDARSDIYALGCVAYEMLAGEPPFTGATSRAIIARHVQAEVPSLRIIRSTIPAAVQSAIERAMAKNPVDRFTTATEFADALAAAASTGSRKASRWKLAAPAIAAAALLAAGYLAWQRWPRAAATDRNLVAIAPFEIRDSALALWREGLVDLVARDLNGAGPLRVVSPSIVMRNWRPEWRADEASALALAKRTGAGLSVTGTLLLLPPDSALLNVTVFDIASPRQLDGIRITGSVNRIDRLADSMTVRLLDVIGQARTLGGARVSTIRPTTLEALKAYLQGEQHFRRTAWDSAQMSYERAIERDSTMALAFHRIFLVRSLQGSGKDSLIWNYALRGGALNHGLAERDSLVVTADSLMAAVLYGGLLSDTVSSRLRDRLFSTLDAATRRFPNDVELWYQLALTRDRIGHIRGVTPQQVEDAALRSIALDSTFAPAYIIAINVAMALGKDADARRHIESYLALGPSGAEADAARVSLAFLDEDPSRSGEAGRLLQAMSAEALWKAMMRLNKRADTAEASVQIVRMLLTRGPEAEKVVPLATLRYTLALNLAWRGHLRQAWEEQRQSHPLFISQLAVFGGVSADTAEAEVERRMREARGRPGVTAYLLPWWHHRRDTVALLDAELQATIAAAAATNPSALGFARYVADAARAYVVLVRGDSAGALRRLQALNDSACGICRFERLTTVRMLNARGLHGEAATLLDRSTTFLAWGSMPADVLLRLENARVRAQLGDVETARRDYEFVAALWARADAPLQPYVEEARAALRSPALARAASGRTRSRDGSEGSARRR